MQTAELEWLLEASSSDATGFYESIGVSFTRTGSEEMPVRCFANPGAHTHDDKNASCSINVLTGLWHCKGCGMSGNAYQAALAMGRSEPQARDLAKRYGLFLEVAREKPRLPYERELKAWRERLMSSPLIVRRLLEVKGWTPKAMVRCSLGWDGERIVFPIRTHRLQRAGVVRYLPGGRPKTLAVAGTKRLLFPPPEVVSRRRPVFLVEGEPDAVSVWSCGHQAVAVPGTGSWRPEWGTRLAGKQVVVLADCDAPGRELAAKIMEVMPRARMVDLAPERSDGYDVGDMLVEALEFPDAHRQMHDLLAAL